MNTAVILWKHPRARRLFASSLSSMVACAVVALSSQTVRCAADVFDDFSDGNDTTSPTWTHSDVGLAGVQSYDASGLSYHLSATVGGFGISYLGSFVDSASDFAMSIDLLNWGGGAQKFGLYARATGINTTFGVSGYHFSYQPDNGQVLIRRMINANQAGSNLASTNYFLEVGKQYQFVFAGNGISLDGKIFEVGGPSTPVVELMATDTTFTSGLSGVLGFGLGAPTDFTIDNFSLAVPEPTSSTLLLLGGVLAWVLRCRRAC